MVSSTLGGSTITCLETTVEGATFFDDILYSSRVEAPMHGSSPLARAGLKILEAVQGS